MDERDESNKVARLIIAQLDNMAKQGMREGRIHIVADALMSFRATRPNNAMQPTPKSSAADGER
jgi:hypothetical protein